MRWVNNVFKACGPGAAKTKCASGGIPEIETGRPARPAASRQPV
jgi:hypothetical protein